MQFCHSKSVKSHQRGWLEEIDHIVCIDVGLVIFSSAPLSNSFDVLQYNHAQSKNKVKPEDDK
ncbi:TPA: hypothetical protein I7730_16265 [Vibrio vulnificus]|uniref:Uncharacterized protein n=1 Tax=Vibrio vulnificus TaxID=672 RepID=A0A8H9N230_VIBVL|nr:hypothetical protein [Vibrio vulnificus]